MTDKTRQLLGMVLSEVVDAWLPHFNRQHDAGSLRRVLSAAYDADTVIDEFVRDVTAVTKTRAAELALPSDGDGLLSFALEVLAPFRNRNARRFLDRAAVDATSLGAFLEYVNELHAQACADATGAEELGEAAIAALDELHTYLLAHSLVGKGYLQTEIAQFGDSEHEGGDEPNTPPASSSREGSMTSSGDAELALAA